MPSAPDASYIGRFAPSPTGPLHHGSLATAAASFLAARTAGGRWLLRIDDLDHRRCRPEATTAILASLQRHGLHWDGQPVYQSRRTGAYESALAVLTARGLTYPCDCRRRQLRTYGPIYPGLCRDREPASLIPPLAVRLRTPFEVSRFVDGCAGPQSLELAAEVGDFNLRRSDRIFSYQLATVVDDSAAGVTAIVRGVDLLHDTHRQMLLQRLLALPTPRYWHLPVVMGPTGVKLAKQTGATALDDSDPIGNLWAAFAHLGLQPPAPDAFASPTAALSWAMPRWQARQTH